MYHSSTSDQVYIVPLQSYSDDVNVWTYPPNVHVDVALRVYVSMLIIV